MNTKHIDFHREFATYLNAAASSRSSSLHGISRDQPDYWTALINAFLVVCALAALAICSWQVEDWKNTQTVNVEPAVANQGFSVSGQHTF